MKRLLLVLSLVITASLAIAQSRTVTGSIVDTEGEPLIGATILEENTSNGTATDIDGKFELNVSGNQDLLVSYTGYTPERIVLNTSNTYDITLSDGVLLDVDIVVSGQGVGIDRKRLTTTVDKVSSKQIERVPTGTIDQILQSKLEGTQIRLSSGQPGTASIIRNRGPITANGNSTPVIIIDGVRVDNLNGNSQLNVGTGGAASSALADIPVESIESVEFIRGGAATTLYGADAANGVIQIFTKKGTSGQARVNVETNLGFNTIEDRFLRFPETKELLYEGANFYQQYRAGVDGGNDRATYNFSGSFLDDDGVDDIDQNLRASFRLGTSARISDNIDFSGSASFVSNYFTRDYNANTSFSRIGQIESTTLGLPSDFTQTTKDSLRANLLEQAENTDITESVRRFTTASSLTWRPFKGFTAKGTFGLDQRRSRSREIASNALLVSKGAVAPGTANQGSLAQVQRDFLTTTTELALQYDIEAGDFSFITNAGGQLYRNIDEQIRIDATDLVEGSELFINSAEQAVDQVVIEQTFGGFYAYENIGYKNKLFVDFGIRLDGNSAFGDDIGFIDLYRVGLTYSLTDEPFMQKGQIAKILTRASFRANFGQASNFPTAFARDRLIAAETYRGTTAFTLGNPGNIALSPEVVDSREFGADFSFINGRIGTSITFYDQKTTDALFTPPSAPSSGQLAQETNVGEISNTGIELQTDFAIVQTNDFDLSVRASITTNKNVVVSSGGAPEFNVGGFTFLGSFIKEGEPLGYLRGGLPVFDAEGNLESVTRNAFLGNPTPDGYGSFGLDFRYKDLTFFTSADYQYGAQGVNVDDVLRFFRGINDEGRIPENSAGASFFDLAGVWVEDADFFKVRNIGVQYQVPGTVLPDAFKALSISFNAVNPLSFATSSFDPEVTGAGIGVQGGFSAGGFGYGTISNPRRFIFTLKASF